MRLAVLLLASVAAGAAAQGAVEAPRAIRVVVDNAYAPYSFQSDDGTLQGILIDQWRAWERKTGIKVEIHAMDWGEALRRMRAGEFDVIDNIVETPARRDYFDFTPAYSTIEAPIYFRRDISGITDLASLKGFPVGVKTGDQHIEQLKGKGVTTLIPFQSNDAIVDAARQHKISVFVADSPSVIYLLNRLGIEAEFRHSAPIFKEELRRAVRKGEPALLRTVSEGFAALQPRELRQIDEKWFGRTIDSGGRYLAYVGYAAAVATLLTAGLFGWNRTLRKGILQRTAALGESERRFRQIAEHIREVFWMTTPGLEEILYVSPAYESVWGRSLESVRQRPQSFMDAIHSDDRERVVGILEGQREKGFEVEYRIVRPDGAVRWIRDRGFPVKDASGKAYRIAGVAEDITERRHAEEKALQIAQKMQAMSEHKEADLRLVIDTIPAMAWSVLPDGRVDSVNQRWLDYTGLSLEKALRESIDIVHPEDLARVRENWLIAMAEGEAYEDEMRLRRADGEYRWFLVRTVPLRDELGSIVKWYGTSTDIEDRKRAEDALRRSEFDLAEAQRIASLGSWTLDIATNTVRWSEELYRVFDVDKTSFGGTHEAFLSRVHPDDRRQVLRSNAEARSSGKPFAVEYRISTRSGRLKHIRELGFARLDGAGAVSGLFGTSQDITERKQAENALRASGGQLQALSRRLVELQESERKDLARELHDRIGQNLTALNINLNILGTALPPQAGDEPRSRLEDSKALVESTTAAIGNILSELRPPMLDEHGLAPALDWYAGQVTARIGVAVSVRDLAPDERPAPEAEMALFRIAQEALNNVVKHARASRAEITLERRGSEYVMSVQDDGAGFDAVEQRTARRPGLGMVIMRERARGVGGRFEVRAQSGSGTRLTVQVPA
jgi:PAS domain S-box-containing protein